MRTALALGLGLVATSGSAHADDALPSTVFLPGAPRALSRSASASPDVAAIGWAYGPRSQLSAGADPGLLLVRRRRYDFRLGISALAIAEGTSRAVFPSTRQRSAVHAAAHPAPRRRGRSSTPPPVDSSSLRPQSPPRAVRDSTTRRFRPPPRTSSAMEWRGTMPRRAASPPRRASCGPAIARRSG
jgi:hypothetical protein